MVYWGEGNTPYQPASLWFNQVTYRRWPCLCELKAATVSGVKLTTDTVHIFNTACQIRSPQERNITQMNLLVLCVSFGARVLICATFHIIKVHSGCQERLIKIKTKIKPKMQMNCALTRQQSRACPLFYPDCGGAVSSRIWQEVKIHLCHPSIIAACCFVRPGVLELFAVSQGVIGIKGVYSNRFLAMNKRGRLHATVSIHTHFTNCLCTRSIHSQHVRTYTCHIKLMTEVKTDL